MQTTYNNDLRQILGNNTLDSSVTARNAECNCCSRRVKEWLAKIFLPEDNRGVRNYTPPLASYSIKELGLGVLSGALIGLAIGSGVMQLFNNNDATTEEETSNQWCNYLMYLGSALGAYLLFSLSDQASREQLPVSFNQAKEKFKADCKQIDKMSTSRPDNANETEKYKSVIKQFTGDLMIRRTIIKTLMSRDHWKEQVENSNRIRTTIESQRQHNNVNGSTDSNDERTKSTTGQALSILALDQGLTKELEKIDNYLAMSPEDLIQKALRE